MFGGAMLQYYLPFQLFLQADKHLLKPVNTAHIATFTYTHRILGSVVHTGIHTYRLIYILEYIKSPP